MRHIFSENIQQSLVDVLLPELRRASEAKFAVAFVTRSGLMLLEKELLKCLERNVHLEFLVGLDFGTTDGKALRWLMDIANQTDKLRFFCFRDPLKDVGPTFHPKLYLLRRASFATAIIGSSNLTEKGLKENVELNVILRDRYDSEVINAVRDIYADFGYQGKPFTPEESYIEIYEEMSNRFRRDRVRALSSKRFGRLMESLEKNEEELPKLSVLDPSALSGWHKLIYEKLSSGEFTTESIYRFAKEFEKAYPRNRHIEDKIRQILQQLRDKGLLKHLGKGRWMKREK